MCGTGPGGTGWRMDKSMKPSSSGQKAICSLCPTGSGPLVLTQHMKTTGICCINSTDRNDTKASSLTVLASSTVLTPPSYPLPRPRVKISPYVNSHFPNLWGDAQGGVIGNHVHLKNSANLGFGIH